MSRKWKIKAEGGRFRLLAPECRSGTVLAHALAYFANADHPAECRHVFGSIPAAYRAIQREESWRVLKARQRKMTDQLMSRNFESWTRPQKNQPAPLVTLQEPPC